MPVTFAPPTGPPVTDTSRISDLPAAVAPTVPAGGRGRRPFVLTAAVIAVVALAVGAFVALTGSSGRGATDVAQPYTLAAAAQQTIDARSVHFDLTLTAGQLGPVTVSGAVDNDTGVMSVTTDLSSLLSLGDSPFPIGDGAITVLVDRANGVAYLGADALGGFLPTDAGWVSIDLAALAEQSGQQLGDITGDLGVDPTDIARSLLDTDDATEVGSEVIDGVDTKHYTVSVDLAAALAALPQDELGPAITDADLPDTIVYDVWVTADNQLRRVAFDNVIDGQAIAMQLDLTTSIDAAGVELPDSSDVFDLTGLLGF